MSINQRKTGIGSVWASAVSVLVGAACVVAVAAPGSALASAADLSGRWVLLQHTVTRAEVPVVGTIVATARVVSIHDLKHKAGRLRGGGEVCSIKIDSGTRFVKTIIPEAFKRSLPPPQINARLLEGDGTLMFKQKRQVVVVGAKLKRPTRDKMPTVASDKRVIDQDDDGHPGVTIRVEGMVSGDIYVAQRSWTQLSGKRLADDLFGGRIYFGNEQHILGTTSSMLKDPPKSRPLPNKSFFRLKRVASSMGCDAAVHTAAKWKQ